MSGWRRQALVVMCFTVHAACAQIGPANPAPNTPRSAAEVPPSVVRENGDVLQIPAVCSFRRCGLIVDFHGWSMTPDDQDLQTNLRALTLELAGDDATPFAVLQPLATGVPPSWAATDIEPLMRRVRAVQRKIGAHESLLIVGGYSMGAGVAARIACAEPESIAAVYLVSGGADTLAECLSRDAGAHAKRLPPWLLLYGEDDRLMEEGSAELLLGTSERLGMSVGRELISASGESRFDAAATHGTIVRHETRNRLVGAHCVPGSRGKLRCDDTPYVTGREIVGFIGRVAGQPRIAN